MKPPLALTVALLFCAALTAAAQSTALTYQGHLLEGGASANGNYDLQFTLKNALTAGATVGTAQTVAPVNAVNGIFTVTLDFGVASFDGSDRWVELGVRSFGNAAAYTVLAPRQRLTPTPYALRAFSATSLTGTVTAGNIANGTITGAMIAPGATLSAGTVTATAFVGNGAGLTNLPASAVATPPPGMVLIPAGAFTMGNSVAADMDLSDADPVATRVSAFYIAVHEVTLSQWQAVYFWATNNGYTFSHAGAGKGVNHPVQTVNWYDVVKWCNARSEQAGKTPVYYTNDAQTAIYKTGKVDVTNGQVKWSANGYRLPTEAEWEKASRGGLHAQRFPWGTTITKNLANYFGYTDISYDLGPNSYHADFANDPLPYTAPVGSFAANGYGLHDMAGNVFEWCWDWYGTPYAGGTDPHGATTGTDRAVRGGGWFYYANDCRSARRDIDTPDSTFDYLGFRVVLSPGQP